MVKIERPDNRFSIERVWNIDYFWYAIFILCTVGFLYVKCWGIHWSINVLLILLLLALVYIWRFIKPRRSHFIYDRTCGTMIYTADAHKTEQVNAPDIWRLAIVQDDGHTYCYVRLGDEDDKDEFMFGTVINDIKIFAKYLSKYHDVEVSCYKGAIFTSKRKFKETVNVRKGSLEHSELNFNKCLWLN